IGFIFQAFNLIGDLTVYENVELPLTYRGMPGAERRQRVQAALERVGMSHRSKHYPAQLSGGQQQRVAVARAVVGDPAILLADEPTGNLDSSNGGAVMDLLRELHRNGATGSCRSGSPCTGRGAWAGGIRAARFSPGRSGRRSARSSRPSRRCSPGPTADGICPAQEKPSLRMGSMSAERSSTRLACTLTSVACSRN